MQRSALPIVVFLSLLIPCLLSSGIRECSSIQEVVSEIQPGSLVIFDLDNTLMRPCQTLGSDEWTQYYVSKLVDTGKGEAEALEEAIGLLHAVYAVTKVQPMEETTAAVISSLQHQNIPIVAVTSRSSRVASITIRQLASIGINLSLTAPSQAYFPLVDTKEAVFDNGIVFTTGKSKKSALLALFKQLSWMPKRIVFLDDKEQHVQDVCSLEQQGIECVGLRYGRADEYIKKLDPYICDIELQSFLSTLPDAQAESNHDSTPLLVPSL